LARSVCIFVASEQSWHEYVLPVEQELHFETQQQAHTLILQGFRKLELQILFLRYDGE
jgi:hypothetical protein